MEASARLLNPTAVNRRLLRLHPRSLPRLPRRPLSPAPIKSLVHAHAHAHFHSARPPLPLRPPTFFPLSLSLSLSLPLSSDPASAAAGRHPLLQATDEPDPSTRGDPSAIWTVVLLGWLGAEVRHLKRYAEMYAARGFRAVRFVVPVREFVGLDLGRGIEERVGELARELVEWCDRVEREGSEPRLLFHTFSNTGWLSYGIILENLQSRSDIIKKIKGCVVDSGPAPEIDPKIWAAGFGAALLKKRSSLTYSSAESTNGAGLDGNINRLNTKDIRPQFSEMLVLFLLESVFTIAFMLPNLNRRLNRIISTLSKNQPLCPQLYLYSSGDKVVPRQLVERFIQEQRSLGINVYAHDFVTSPHVDHYRSFPHIYSSKVHEFLKECGLVAVCEA